MSTSTLPSDRLNRLLSFMTHDSGNVALRKDAIREAMGLGEWSIARDLIETGLQMCPDEPDLLALAGSSHLQALRYADAEHAFCEALARGVEAAEVRYNLAFALFMQRRFCEALEALSVAAVAESVPIALLLRARCQHHLGRPEEAMADCWAHLAVAPDSAETHGVLALLLHEQGHSNSARMHAETALGHDPKQLEAMLVRASLYFDVREYEVALACYSTLLEAHPECGRAWLGLSLINLSRMQVDTALRNIKLAAGYMPEHVGTWHVLAWIQIMRHDVAAAAAAFERALGLDRNFGETHGGLAVIAALQGRNMDAHASIKRALRLDPQSLSARYAQILLLQSAGQRAEADAVLEAVLTRPVDREGTQYRDLVAVQLEYFRSTSGRRSAPTVH